jgi:hypothetical protein
MIKKLLFVVFAVGLLAACNNQSNEEATAVTTTEFATVAENMVDKTVTIEGTVLHVCKHGGKKMFIGDDRVKIIASETLAAFDQELEGSTVTVTGIIREEAVPILAEDTAEPKHEEGSEEPGDEEVEEQVVGEDGEVKVAATEECDMEKVKPLYVIEVVKVTEKVQ